ncbi:hypothetical protein BgAZ_204980 [Babesia gibsoni]|uniref:Uncharacterized protein n=1 Tax=Babesia gibsoni TaxID=33632 RepID=A0AAD8LS25_BABGI|nr:hypothetical protein BgAZ_204980 [Babesia gibsoni]
MGKNNIHSFCNIPLRYEGEKVQLSHQQETNEGYAVKIEIERSIHSEISPNDVLTALQSCDFDDDRGDMIIKDRKYSFKFIPPKAATFTLGDAPANSEDISSRFLGTVFISQYTSHASDVFGDKREWQLQQSYRKFHKPTPFGYDDTSRSN